MSSLNSWKDTGYITYGKENLLMCNFMYLRNKNRDRSMREWSCNACISTYLTWAVFILKWIFIVGDYVNKSHDIIWPLRRYVLTKLFSCNNVCISEKPTPSHLLVYLQGCLLASHSWESPTHSSALSPNTLFSLSLHHAITRKP